MTTGKNTHEHRRATAEHFARGVVKGLIPGGDRTARIELSPTPLITPEGIMTYLQEVKEHPELQTSEMRRHYSHVFEWASKKTDRRKPIGYDGVYQAYVALSRRVPPISGLGSI
jgi:hypothetical protein